MKKTLVAIAAVVATTGAMAEATISGGVDFGYINYHTGSTSTTIMAGDTNQNNNIAFNAGEDLGIGLTAKAKIDLGIDYSQTQNSGFSGATFTRESWVGLSGAGFGDISLGRQYAPIFIASTIDPIGLPAKSIGQESLNSMYLVGGNIRDVRLNGSLTYTTPSFSGFKVNIVSALSGMQYDSTIGETNGYGLSYTNEGLSINYQTQTSDLDPIADISQDAIAGTNDSGNWLAGTDATKRSIAAFSYNMGFATLVYINGQAKNNAITASTNYFAIGVPIAGTPVTLGASVNTGSFTQASSSEAKVNGSMLKANYAFSKRTNAYLIYGSDKTDSNGSDRTTTSTSFGLSHTF